MKYDSKLREEHCKLNNACALGSQTINRFERMVAQSPKKTFSATSSKINEECVETKSSDIITSTANFLISAPDRKVLTNVVCGASRQGPHAQAGENTSKGMYGKNTFKKTKISEL